MIYKKFGFVILFFSLNVVHAQNLTVEIPENGTVSQNTSTASYLSLPIYSIHYHISKGNEVELIGNLIVQKLYYTLISSEDMINLLDSKDLIVPLKLTEANFTRIIEFANISTVGLILRLIEHVPAKKISNIRKILEGFNVNYENYTEYFMEVNDKGMLQLLTTGNYTTENIENALKIIGKTEAQVLTIIKPVLLTPLYNVTITKIVYEFDEEISSLFSNTDLTLGSIMQYKSFSNMLKFFSDTLNNETLWSTAISNDKLLTVSSATNKLEYIQDYVHIHINNIQNSTITNSGGISINGSFSVITVNKILESFINKATNYTSEDINKCYYVVQTDAEGLILYNVLNATLKGDYIWTENKYGLTHRLGSPLICKDLLYGILVGQGETKLKFVILDRNEASTYPTDDIDDEDDHDHSGAQKNYCNLFVMISIISFIILLQY